MQASRLAATLLTCVVLMATVGCENAPQERGHAGEGAEEEPNVRIGLTDTVDTVRRGVRLILAYDKTSSSFIGTVENVSSEKVHVVRVEVHLSNGVELGPTSPEDLAPGNRSNVNLSAAGQSFTWWKAHAETSGAGGEGGEEHGHDDDSGHGGEGEREGEHH
ncbi:MAG: hypothetical protein ACYTBJ_17950 [Planctomycetota bacterium]